MLSFLFPCYNSLLSALRQQQKGDVLGALGITVGPFMYLGMQDGQKPQTPDQANKHKHTDLRLF